MPLSAKLQSLFGGPRGLQMLQQEQRRLSVLNHLVKRLIDQDRPFGFRPEQSIDRPRIELKGFEVKLYLEHQLTCAWRIRN